ncbi:hypothetical protein ACH5RR_028912 [Cinchona calisaya]|uniref:Retrotransposon gag domain-containing protein n=1 Tax=Cinchona calisaya TaxID=153742 RepID=A0ABD2YQ53_9GENT
MRSLLMQRFIHLSTAKEIWEAVAKTFYDGSDETCLFELNRKSFSTTQHGRPLSTYCTELIAIFQEIDHRMISQEGTVYGVILLNSAMARLRVHNFLSGLDPKFDQFVVIVVRQGIPNRDAMKLLAILTGASDHMTRDSGQLQSICPSSQSVISTANGGYQCYDPHSKKLHVTLVVSLRESEPYYSRGVPTSSLQGESSNDANVPDFLELEEVKGFAYWPTIVPSVELQRLTSSAESPTSEELPLLTPLTEESTQNVLDTCDSTQVNSNVLNEHNETNTSSNNLTPRYSQRHNNGVPRK